MTNFFVAVSHYYRDIPAQMVLSGENKSYTLGRYQFMVGAGLAILFAVYESAKTVLNALTDPLNIKNAISERGYQTLVYCAAVPVGFFGLSSLKQQKTFSTLKAGAKLKSYESRPNQS